MTQRGELEKAAREVIDFTKEIFGCNHSPDDGSDDPCDGDDCRRCYIIQKLRTALGEQGKVETK